MQEALRRCKTLLHKNLDTKKSLALITKDFQNILFHEQIFVILMCAIIPT